MSFRYQKRINLGKGSGLNIGKRGVSYSKRTKWGTIGTQGWSLKTGIPGLSLRQNWGKKDGSGLMILLVLGGFVVVSLIIYNLATFIWHLISSGYALLRRKK